MKLRTRIILALILCVSASLRFNAQVRPVNDYGALGLGHLLNRLNTTASVMMIGAHPDDEDSALLAYLARGENARTAYLSLTRGDGGQNIIGPELGEALGIIRTEELLQARRLDGGEQFFTRAYDYGFSKTLAEAKSRWPEDVIKCDVVRAIRLFRPMVVISRFTGTPADGHGQHQYAGYISPIAVKAAADPKQCTDAGEPWQVLKFYVEQSFGDTSQPTLRINTGQYDPLLGRTFFEIAMEGRSQHRSQGEGRIEFRGDQFSGLNLSGANEETREKSLFDGLNIAGWQVDLEPAAMFSDFAQPQKRTLGDLYRIYQALELVSRPTNKSFSENDLDSARKLVKAALQAAGGVGIDALASVETVVPGEEFMVSVKAFQPKNTAVGLGNASLTVPDGWKVTKVTSPTGNNAAYNSREVAAAESIFMVAAPVNAELTQPYWLTRERSGDLFNWSSSKAVTLPFDEPALIAHVQMQIAKSVITLDQPMQYRFADPARGEIRREVNVVPPVSVEVDKDLVIIPRGVAQVRRMIKVRVVNNTSKAIRTVLSVIKPSVGTVSADLTKSAVDLAPKGAASVDLDLRVIGEMRSPPFTVGVVADVDGTKYSQTLNTVSYPHIQTHRYYTRAAIKVVLLDLVVEPVKVAYIMGSGDEVPDAIRQMGMDVTMLEEKDLASGDFSRFDTIVVGIRASETRADLVANNARLLDYVRNGGNVIMLYQRFNWTGLAPFPVDTNDKQGTTAGNIARVVDENAPVKIIEPAHPVFNFPNKITDKDFDGWVQERNAYNLVTFDAQYTPLLESHDAGEQENKGGLVVAKVGKGNWVYCSYSFFRQLPAGVPGAYRLFANLLSLGQNRERSDRIPMPSTEESGRYRSRF